MNDLDNIVLPAISSTLELTMKFVQHSLVEADATGDKQLKARLVEIIACCDMRWQAIKLLAKPREPEGKA